MVKLIVKKAFRRASDFTLVEVGTELEVSEEAAELIEKQLPGYTEVVKPKQSTKQTQAKKPTKRQPRAKKTEDKTDE